VSVLTERRTIAPYGLAGGGPGATGKNLLVRGVRKTRLPGKANIDLKAGERIRIETPGGGGWGRR
jgi:N-methylhydantoinase B/oxoprolinase/acetone carboxylase alpha subunit